MSTVFDEIAGNKKHKRLKAVLWLVAVVAFFIVLRIIHIGLLPSLVAYPDWFVQGLASRPSKNRRCFTTWNHFTRTSPLIPSGLVGTVVLLGRCDRLANRCLQIS